MIHVVVTIGLAQMLPMRIFLATEVVARLREGGHPVIAFFACVPTHMVKVQVGAQHAVDLLGRKACGSQVLQEADTETDEGLEELVSDVALALLRSEVIPQAPPPHPKP